MGPLPAGALPSSSMRFLGEPLCPEGPFLQQSDSLAETLWGISSFLPDWLLGGSLFTMTFPRKATCYYIGPRSRAGWVWKMPIAGVSGTQTSREFLIR